MNNSSATGAALYVVATPIGHLEDMSPRAVRCLGEVECVLAEDTRRCGQLLRHLGLSVPMRSTHEHNEAQRLEFVLGRLAAGARLAVVSDAGTPLISDPGFQLVRAAHAAGHRVIPIPGPCAVTTALSVAGLPTDRFCFEGFLPSRSQARQERLRRLAAEPRTLVFFEAARRVAKCVDDMVECLGGDRRAALCRELTKIHEQVLNAPLGELAAAIGGGQVTELGEIVLVVAGAAPRPADEDGIDADVDRWLLALAGALPPADAARIAAKASGLKRAVVYRRLLELTR